ncbi:MAG: MerR family transcriptional regulator [Anaerofustis stercorihominis]|nr:MerR family transcriptional regulator [Anaerofustis stercorihominis]
MKMKELRDRLTQSGYDISERMIKYYIELGILPQPEYTFSNQANYDRIHLLRLKRIGYMKQNGKSFPEIKRLLLNEQKDKKKIAERKGISFEEFSYSFMAYAMEELDYLTTELKIQHHPSQYTKDELLEESECNKLVFELALDTGVLKDKEYYNTNELLILICVRNLIECKIGTNESGGLVEKISDISKINSISSQFASFFARDKDMRWIYSQLSNWLIEDKLQKMDESLPGEI